MEPITVVTPFTIAHPRSDPDEAVAGAERRGPAPCAADSAQIIIETKVTKEMVFIVMKSLFVLSGGKYSIGIVIKLYTTQPMN